MKHQLSSCPTGEDQDLTSRLRFAFPFISSPEVVWTQSGGVQHTVAVATRHHWPLVLEMSLKWSVCFRFKQHITQRAVWSIPGLTSSFHLWLNQPSFLHNWRRRRGGAGHYNCKRNYLRWGSAEKTCNDFFLFHECLMNSPGTVRGAAEEWRLGVQEITGVTSWPVRKWSFQSVGLQDWVGGASSIQNESLNPPGSSQPVHFVWLQLFALMVVEARARWAASSGAVSRVAFCPVNVSFCGLTGAPLPHLCLLEKLFN